MKKIFLVYCLWIWILTPLFYFNLIDFSLLYSSFFALLFTTYNNFLVTNYSSLYKRILVFLWEIFILSINYIKHFIIDKRKLFNLKDILFNIGLFIFYLIFIHIFYNETFFNLYFVKLRR